MVPIVGVALLLFLSFGSSCLAQQGNTTVGLDSARHLLARSVDHSDDRKLADSLAVEVFGISRSLHHDSLSAKAALQIAMMRRDPHPRDGYQWGDTAIFYAQRMGDLFTEATANRVKAQASAKMNHYDDAVTLLTKACDQFLALDDTASYITSTVTLSLFYHNDVKDYQRGLEIAMGALEYIHQYSAPPVAMLWRTNNAIAINYDDANDAENALKYHYENLTIAAGDSNRLGSTHNNIGNTLLKRLGKVKEAESHFQIALSMAVANDDPLELYYDYSTVYNNLSNVQWELHNTAKGRALRDSAIIYARLSLEHEKLYDAYYDAYYYYDKNKDSQQAIAFLKKFYALKDSVFSLERAKALSDFETQYETQQKENEISLLKSRAEVQELRLRQSQDILFMAFGVVLLALALTALLIRRRQHKLKLQVARDQEAQQRREFGAVLATEEKERTRIATDLHDGVGQLLSVIKLNLTSLEMEERHNPAMLTNAISTLDHATDELRAVSHNLMPPALSTAGLQAAVADLAMRINQAGSINVTHSFTNYDERLAPEIEITIYRLIQEITNNMLKHARAGKIHIEVSRQDSRIMLRLSDDGIGFDKELVHTSQGIGWKNVLSRVALVNGDIDIQSTTGKGTAVSITFEMI